jgi:hypothetical protein
MAPGLHKALIVVAAFVLLATCRRSDGAPNGSDGAIGSGGNTTGSGGATASGGSPAGSGGGAGVTTDATGTGGTSAGDGPCNACWYGHCIDRGVCLAATPIEIGVTLPKQDTGLGGYGDCAQSGSSGGERQLYYSLLIPAGGAFARHVRVVAAPVDSSQDAVMRVLSDCDAQVPENAARGGRSTDGAASLCAANATPNPRKVIIAVGHYSNATEGLVFDLSTELMAPDAGCSP